MPQTISLDHRQSAHHPDLDLGAGEILAPAQGDFARGQRHDSAAGRVRGDFATGMRTTSMLRVAGDFASGMRTLPRVLTVGDFATGMRTGSSPVVIDEFTSPVDALALAA